MNSILLALASVAGLGLALSIAVHVAALFGVALFGQAAFVLHVGIFVVWFPMVLASQRRLRNVPQKDFWKAALIGCPPWMKWLTYGLFGYALVNFAFFFITRATGGMKPSGSGPDVATLRGFSGHWMAFYAAAMCMLYASVRTPTLEGRRCDEGHPIGALANFCERCGRPVPPAT